MTPRVEGEQVGGAHSSFSCSMFGPVHKASTGLVACATLLVALLLYSQTLFHEFINFDDPVYVSDNPNLKTLSAGYLRWAFTSFYYGHWSPLLWVSYGLDYSIWGANPLGYHLANIVLHGLNSFLVVVVTARLGMVASLSMAEQRIAAAVTGLFYAAHPFHVESVAWIADRKDLLAALFCLLSTIAYIRHAGSNAGEGSKGSFPGFLALSLGLFSLAAMSKSTAVTLPAAFLILDVYPLKRFRHRADYLRFGLLEKIPFLAASLASAALTLAAAKSREISALDQSVEYPLWERFLTALHALDFYLKNTFLPIDLSPYHTLTIQEPRLSSHLASLALPVTLTLASWILRRRAPALAASWGFFLVTISPTLGVVRIFGITSIADRFMYLPLLGPLVAVGAAAALVWRKAGMVLRHLLPGAIFVVLAILSTLTWKQSKIWSDSVSLWSSVLSQTPSGDVANIKLAEAYAAREDHLNAVAHYSAAIDYYGFEPETYFARGRSYFRLGLFQQALEDLSAAIKMERMHQGMKRPEGIRMSLARFHEFRGVIFMTTSRYQEALDDWQLSASLGNTSVDLDAGSGSALFKLGRYQEALAAFTRVAAVHPDSPWVNFSLAETLRALGHEKEAHERYILAADAGWQPAREALANKGPGR